MSKDVTTGVEFTPESVPEKAGRRPMTGVELLTIGALTVSTVIAATAVSMGIARAAVIDTIPDHQTPIALLMLVGLILAGMVGLTALAARNRSARR